MFYLLPFNKCVADAWGGRGPAAMLVATVWLTYCDSRILPICHMPIPRATVLLILLVSNLRLHDFMTGWSVEGNGGGGGGGVCKWCTEHCFISPTTLHYPLFNPGHGGRQSQAERMQRCTVHVCISICKCVARHDLSVALMHYVAYNGVQ